MKQKMKMVMTKEGFICAKCQLEMAKRKEGWHRNRVSETTYRCMLCNRLCEGEDSPGRWCAVCAKCEEWIETYLGDSK